MLVQTSDTWLYQSNIKLSPIHSYLDHKLKFRSRYHLKSIILLSGHSVFGFWFWTHLKFSLQTSLSVYFKPWPNSSPIQLTSLLFLSASSSTFLCKILSFFCHLCHVDFSDWGRRWRHLQLSTRGQSNRDATLIRMFFHWILLDSSAVAPNHSQ